jgi:thiosulfate dehydrogenase (quinone) large subunit
MTIASSARKTVSDRKWSRSRSGETEPVVSSSAARYALAGLRICLGWIFLWTFLDKTFGLGFATESDKAWINGGSPTTGFLKFGTEGVFADMHRGMAGSALVDWLFMVGMLCLGVALIAGVALRITAVAGVTMLTLLWSGVVPPENNPMIDQHWVYALALITFPLVKAGHTLGLGATWERLPLVRRYSFLY